jgi:zeta-carotene isomerase
LLIKERTSVVPFAAIISGKQELPPDFYKEFLRLPYLTIIIGSIVAYYAHPFMQAGSALLDW